MLDEYIQPDSFTSPLHTLPGDVRKSLNQVLETFKSHFAWLRQALEPLISLKCKLTWMTQNLSCRTKQTSSCMGTLQQPFQSVRTYLCSAQGRWWKMPSD